MSGFDIYGENCRKNYYSNLSERSEMTKLPPLNSLCKGSFVACLSLKVAESGWILLNDTQSAGARNPDILRDF
jgi:hypothetical protein